MERPVLVNIAPPRQLKSPVRIEKILGYSGKAVIKGEEVLLVSGMDGEFAAIAAKMDGTLFFPSTVFEGAQVSHDEVLLSIDVVEETPAQSAPEPEPVQEKPAQPEARKQSRPKPAKAARPKPEKKAQPKPETTAQPAPASHDAEATTHPSVEQDVIRERENAPSAIYRSLWVADKPGVTWGGVGPVIRMCLSILVFALLANVLFRLAFPDRTLDQMAIPSVLGALLAIYLTVRLVRKWKRRPSPKGFIFPFIVTTMISIMGGILPDDAIFDMTGIRMTSFSDMTGVNAGMRAEIDSPLYGPSYIFIFKDKMFGGEELVERIGPFDDIYDLEHGTSGVTKALVSTCNTAANDMWSEIISVDDGYARTLKRYDDRCATPCDDCGDYDVILFDIYGTDDRGYPEIDRYFSGPKRQMRFQAGIGYPYDYCALDYRRC
jgi:hypothetical protein